MIRTEVAVPTPDGTCPATLHTPAGTGPWPAVIVFPDAGGVRETFLALADRVADLGYVAFLPDVYYRHGGYTPFDLETAFSDEAERARLMALVRSLTPEFQRRDAGAFLDFLATRRETTGAVGATGYCMGGGYAARAAGGNPDRVAAVASFHGGHLAVADDPESPHRLADRLHATVYVAVAQDDHAFPPDQYERLEQALRDAGVTYTLETYPAAHGFAVPDMPTHDAAAERRHWAALTELLAATLPG